MKNLLDPGTVIDMLQSNFGLDKTTEIVKCMEAITMAMLDYPADVQAVAFDLLVQVEEQAKAKVASEGGLN